jgi:hypothetical protein
MSPFATLALRRSLIARPAKIHKASQIVTNPAFMPCDASGGVVVTALPKERAIFAVIYFELL